MFIKYYFSYASFFYVKLTQAIIIKVVETLPGKIPLPNKPVGKSVVHFLD